MALPKGVFDHAAHAQQHHVSTGKALPRLGEHLVGLGLGLGLGLDLGEHLVCTVKHCSGALYAVHVQCEHLLWQLCI